LVDGGNMVYFRRKSASHVEIIRYGHKNMPRCTHTWKQSETPSVWLYLFAEGISKTCFAKKRITIPERSSRPEMAELYRLYCRSTRPTFRCPNHCINASTGWAYRTRCLKSKQETAAFGVDGNENAHFKKDLRAVAAFSSCFIPKRIPGTADALSCFERVATTTTPTINPHTISQPS